MPTSTVGVLYLFVCRSAANGSARKVKVISTTQKKKHRYIYSQKNPRKNCSKLGVARDCHAQHCRDGDWLTEAPVFQNGGGSGSWHKSTRDPYFPRGESPPRHNPPLSPSGVGARVHRTHQEAFTVFVVICEITSISMLLPGTCNPPFKNDSSASRKDTLLHLILSLYSQASATQMDTISGIHPPLQDTSFFTFYIYAIITCPPPSKYTILQNLCNPWYHSS